LWVSLESFKVLPESALEPVARTLPWLEVAAWGCVVVRFLHAVVCADRRLIFAHL